MADVNFIKQIRNDGQHAWYVKVNGTYICNIPNFNAGARTIFPHVARTND
jgi:hypothetical protein